jgi:hypothetical protein
MKTAKLWKREEQGLAPNQNANQKTNDGNSGSDKVYVIELPFKDRLCGVCLRAGNGNNLALSLSDEVSHTSRNHRHLEILYKCTRCIKTYKSKHGGQCHLPKCNGSELETSTPPQVQKLREGFQNDEGSFPARTPRAPAGS